MPEEEEMEVQVVGKGSRRRSILLPAPKTIEKLCGPSVTGVILGKSASSACTLDEMLVTTILRLPKAALGTKQPLRFENAPQTRSSLVPRVSAVTR